MGFRVWVPESTTWVQIRAWPPTRWETLTRLFNGSLHQFLHLQNGGHKVRSPWVVLRITYVEMIITMPGVW